MRIVPTGRREVDRPVIELYRASSHFHVVVTNVSGEPVRLWKEWCSWGYFNLSFVATAEGGRPVTVVKQPRGWDKNYPDWEVVPPGGHHVREVTFDPATWPDVPLPEPNRSKPVRMKAVFSIRPDNEAKEHGVWTGQVSSPEELYTIWK
jgi:hypothetical protein